MSIRCPQTASTLKVEIGMGSGPLSDGIVYLALETDERAVEALELLKEAGRCALLLPERRAAELLREVVEDGNDLKVVPVYTESDHATFTRSFLHMVTEYDLDMNQFELPRWVHSRTKAAALRPSCPRWDNLSERDLRKRFAQALQELHLNVRHGPSRSKRRILAQPQTGERRHGSYLVSTAMAMAVN